MIFLSCSRCGADVGRTEHVDLIDQLYALHGLHCPERVPAPTPVLRTEGEGDNDDK